MKKILIVVLLFCLFTGAIGQKNLDIFVLSGRYGFPAPYEETYTGKATETGTFLALTGGVPIGDKATWVVSLNHFYFNVSGDPAIPGSIANPVKLNGIILRTGIYRKFENGTGIQALFAPRYMNDFNGGGAKCFQPGGIFLFEKVFSKTLTTAFGAQFNQDLFGPFLTPIVNLDWQVSSKWRFSGMLPIYSKLSYKVNGNLDLGFAHFGLITSYYLADPGYKGDYIQRNSIDLTLYARQRVKGNVFLELRGGMATGRSYEQFAGDQKVSFGLPLAFFGDDRTVKSTKFDGGPILDFRLIYSIPMPE